MFSGPDNLQGTLFTSAEEKDSVGGTQKKIVTVASVLAGTGLLVSALSESWISVAVGSLTLAALGYPVLRENRTAS